MRDRERCEYRRMSQRHRMAIHGGGFLLFSEALWSENRAPGPFRSIPGPADISFRGIRWARNSLPCGGGYNRESRKIAYGY
jgi:hypothetical protein